MVKKGDNKHTKLLFKLSLHSLKLQQSVNEWKFGTASLEIRTFFISFPIKNSEALRFPPFTFGHIVNERMLNISQAVYEPAMYLFSLWRVWAVPPGSCRTEAALRLQPLQYIYNPPSVAVCVCNALRRKSSPVSHQSHRGAERQSTECACLFLLLITGPSAAQHAHTLPPSEDRLSGCHQLTPGRGVHTDGHQAAAAITRMLRLWYVVWMPAICNELWLKLFFFLIDIFF